MAVYLYDEALIQKLKKWTEKTQVTVLSTEESKRLFEIISDENDDKKLKLPIIALTRNGGYSLKETTKQVGTYDGIKLSSDGNESISMKKIPISLTYRLDIYTRYMKEADEYCRELVFNLINYPTFRIVVPYNGVNIELNANISLGENVEDNSDIPERLIAGQFTRLSINFTVDDALLLDTRVKANVSIDTEETGGLEVYKEEGSSDVVIEDLFID